MKLTKWLAVLCVGLSVMVAGCLPRRVAWAPDGSRAIVWAADGLHVMDAAGKLGAAGVKDGGPIAWMPDGKHVVVAHVEPAKTWDEINADLSQEEWTEITDNAAIIRQEALQYNGDWDKFGDVLQGKVKWVLTENGLLKSLMYLRDKKSEGLKEKLAARWTDAAKMEVPMNAVRVYELDGAAWKEGPRLAWRGHGILDLRPSPNGKAVLIAEQQPHGTDGKQQLARLLVASAGGGEAVRVIAEQCSRYGDWTRDGRGIVYGRWTAGDLDGNELAVGYLGRRTVAEADGTLHGEADAEERLAYIAFDQFMCVRGLSAERVLFTGNLVGLPSSAQGKGPRNIFVFDPQNPKDVRTVFKPEGDKPLDAICLDVSPDEKHIVVTEGKGRVAVVDVASGAATWIAREELPDVQGAQPGMVATWRNNDEFTFVQAVSPQPAADSGLAADVIVLSNLDRSKKTVLSAEWAAEAQQGWLIGKAAEQGK